MKYKSAKSILYREQMSNVKNKDQGEKINKLHLMRRGTL